jgi:hypothetical protein
MSESAAPATRYVAVTPSDTTVLGCRAIYVGGAGNLSLQAYEGGPTVVFTAPAVGVEHPLSAYRIMAATTATAIVALY